MANWPNLDISTLGCTNFCGSGLDINGCVLSYFEGTANLHKLFTVT